MRRHDFCSALRSVRRNKPGIEDERGTTDLLRAIIRYELQVKTQTSVAPQRLRMLVRDLRVRVPKPA